ncbi:MAG: hypothetical protein IJS82_06145 [Paludibacteraceae bacterium]|nr:hypothetical protein [Paludibacteraceae bacterium]
MKRVLECIIFLMIGLGGIAGIVFLLRRWCMPVEECAAWAICIRIYHYAWKISGILFGAGLLCRIALSPFVKSDEQEDFENKLDYVLQLRQTEQARAAQDNYSPLRNLTPEQETKVIEHLRALPSNTRNPNAVHLAIIARYLTALEQLGKANLTDKHDLRLWVQKITGKEVPSSSQFNEAIPNRNRKELQKARTEWEKLLR